MLIPKVGRIVSRALNQPLGPVLGLRSASQYRFTYGDNSKLTAEQRCSYEKNGFLIVKNVFEPELVAKYGKRFEDIACGRVKVPGMTVMRDVGGMKGSKTDATSVVYKLQDIFLDDELFKYCEHPPLLDYIEAFVGPNLMAMHTMLISKPPDSGVMTSRHPLHQDLHYFPFRPADRIVCAWTAIERTNRENGCLVGIPGSHTGALQEHGYPEWEGGVNKAFHGIKNFNEVIGDRVYLEMEAGDTVFFHPVLIHGSGANRSKGLRRAISCHYAASECEYIDVTGTSQQEIADEVLRMAEKKGMPLTDFRDAWRYRARLVRGEQISL